MNFILKVTGCIFDKLADFFWWLHDKAEDVGDWCYFKRIKMVQGDVKYSLKITLEGNDENERQ